MTESPFAAHEPNLNGYHAAPPPASGGALYSAQGKPSIALQQSVFPPDLQQVTLRSLLYWLGWAEMGGQRLRRWLGLVLVALCVALALLRVPGGLWLAIGCGVLLALVWLLPIGYRRSHFVRFVPEDGASLASAGEPLPPSGKIPVHVSGTLSVGGKRRDFLWLPAFYRTFATREHALLGFCRDRRILGIGAPPEADVGLWYAFWYAHQLVSMRPGQVTAGGSALPGIRLDYHPAGKKGRLGAPPAPDTIYIACTNANDRERIWRDLHADVTAATTPDAETRATEMGSAHPKL